jgi:DNA-binding transcriptional MerR regulator
MPYKEAKIEKMFYSIGEVAGMFGENTSLIRFWANKFNDVIKPQKNKKGNRMFTPEDIANFRIIHQLVRENGMTLDGAHKRIKDNRTGEDRSAEVRESLERIKEELLTIKELI